MSITKNLNLHDKKILGNVLPHDDDKQDLGDSTHEFKDAYIDGVLYVDKQDRVNTDGAVSHNNFCTITATGILAATNRIILCNVTDDATLTLPPAASLTGQILTIKSITSGTCVITLDGNASETIDGSTTNTNIDAQYDTLTLISDGSNWHIINYKIS